MDILKLKENMTQEQLAEAIGVCRKTVQNWERDRSEPKISIPLIRSLCSALNCTTQELSDSFLGELIGQQPHPQGDGACKSHKPQWV